MRTKLNAMRAIPGLVAVMLAAACGSTATSDPGAPPGGEPPDSPATKPGTASSRIVQVGSTITKGCKGTAIFDLIGAEPIDAVKIDATGTRDLATELYTVDAKGKMTKLAKRARTVSSTEDSATRKESADEPMTSSRLMIAPGEPNPSAPDDTVGEEKEPIGDTDPEAEADGDDDTAIAESALTATDSGSGDDSASKLAVAVAKSVSDMASKGLALPGSATSGGGASGLGSVTPGASGLFPGQAELIAAIEKKAAEGRSTSQQAFDDIHKQALEHADGVKQRIADAQAGKGLGPIDVPGSEEQPGGPNETPEGPGGQPASGGGGEPTTGGGATAGGEPTTGGGSTSGGIMGNGVPRSPVGYRGQKGVKASPKQQGRMYDGLKGMNSKHFRLRVTFQATKSKPSITLVEHGADKDVLAQRSFSSAFPTSCK